MMKVTAENMSLMLQQLCRLGKPRLSLIGMGASKGWHASIDLPAPAGCKAEVASDFNGKTPEAAVQQMVDRLEELRGADVAQQAENPRLIAA